MINPRRIIYGMFVQLRSVAVFANLVSRNMCLIPNNIVIYVHAQIADNIKVKDRCFNKLTASDDIWCHKYGLTIDLVMAAAYRQRAIT